MRTVLFLLFLSIPCFGYWQDNTGFYIQIDKKTNCPQEVKTLDDIQVFCIPNKPILDRGAFTSISDIQIETAGKRKIIDLHISPKGMELLKTVVNSLPNATLVLVVDNKVVGILKNKDIVGKFIRIDSDIASRRMEWIHEHLKTAP